MATLVIDNVGFDIEAMKKVSERDFINMHLSNDAIAPWKSEQGRKQYLKDAYARINPKVEKESNSVEENE